MGHPLLHLVEDMVQDPQMVVTNQVTITVVLVVLVVVVQIILVQLNPPIM